VLSGHYQFILQIGAHDLNYDGLTDLLEIYEKVCNINRQLLKADMKTVYITSFTCASQLHF